MKLFQIFGLIGLIVASASAEPHQHDANSMKSIDWNTFGEMKSLPATTGDITMQQLENMSVEEGEKFMRTIFRMFKVNEALTPAYVPSPSSTPVIFMKPNGQHMETTLTDMVSKAKSIDNFGNDEVTIFITGLPETSPAVAKANTKLIEAYMARYMGQQRSMGDYMRDYEAGNKKTATSSEEDSEESKEEGRQMKGDFVIIKLGNSLTNIKRYTQFDIEKTGEMLAKVLVDLTNKVDVPQETIHLIGQGMSAHVAGVAARTFKRLTGHRLRRITALDPAKKYASYKYTLPGLARGDADFVDAIHTNTRGLGTPTRTADVDFYVMGLGAVVPGAENIIEASMRATRYFAESVRPGSEHNFPAVPANSLRQYERKDGSGKRAYMGIATAYDLKGDYMLEVNAKSPFGMSAPAKKQSTYHDLHQSWQSAKKEAYQYY